jgi:hypothetical protein
LGYLCLPIVGFIQKFCWDWYKLPILKLAKKLIESSQRALKPTLELTTRSFSFKNCTTLFHTSWRSSIIFRLNIDLNQDSLLVNDSESRYLSCRSTMINLMVLQIAINSASNLYIELVVTRYYTNSTILLSFEYSNKTSTLLHSHL